jgi:hypothetical protein
MNRRRLGSLLRRDSVRRLRGRMFVGHWAPRSRFPSSDSGAYCAGPNAISVVTSNWPEKPIQIRADNSLFEVDPNSLLVPAIITTTRNWTVLMNFTVHAASIEVMTIAVFALSDKVGMSEVPLYNVFFDILMRKGRARPATGSFAKMQPARTVDFNRAFECVLVVLRILIARSNSFFPKLFNETACDLLFLSIQNFDVQGRLDAGARTRCAARVRRAHHERDSHPPVTPPLPRARSVAPAGRRSRDPPCSPPRPDAAARRG